MYLVCALDTVGHWVAKPRWVVTLATRVVSPESRSHWGKVERNGFWPLECLNLWQALSRVLNPGQSGHVRLCAQRLHKLYPLRTENFHSIEVMNLASSPQPAMRPTSFLR